MEEGWAIRTEPHPRFYTDPTDTTPIAVPALIRRWWPMIFFLVFKSPPEGKTHIFRPGEPFAQILGRARGGGVRPRSDVGGGGRRARIAVAAHLQSRATLSAETQWTSATNTVFDGTYRHILGAASERAKQQR